VLTLAEAGAIETWGTPVPHGETETTVELVAELPNPSVTVRPTVNLPAARSAGKATVGVLVDESALLLPLGLVNDQA
jgi:hypothetical protein